GDEPDESPASAQHVDGVDRARIAAARLAQVDLAPGRQPRDDAGGRDRSQQVADEGGDDGEESLCHALRLRTDRRLPGPVGAAVSPGASGPVKRHKSCQSWTELSGLPILNTCAFSRELGRACESL